jgi:hypothetical protein
MQVFEFLTVSFLTPVLYHKQLLLTLAFNGKNVRFNTCWFMSALGSSMKFLKAIIKCIYVIYMYQIFFEKR